MDILNNRYKEALNRKRHAENEDLQRYLFLDIDGVLNTIRYSDYLIDHDEDEYDPFVEEETNARPHIQYNTRFRTYMLFGSHLSGE